MIGAAKASNEPKYPMLREAQMSANAGEAKKPSTTALVLNGVCGSQKLTVFQTFQKRGFIDVQVQVPETAI